MTRTKAIVEGRTVYTREDAEKLLIGHARASHELKAVEIMMEEKISKIREQYAERIGTLTQAKEDSLKKLHLFAEQNHELFQDKKSLDLTHGTIGYRKGTPSLVLATKVDKDKEASVWDKALNKIKSMMPTYIRVKEEIDKRALISKRLDPKIAKNLEKAGLKVVTTETFYVDIKTEDITA